MRITIRYEGAPGKGHGHRIRMERLAKVLRQRGADVNIGPANFVEILDTLKRHSQDVLVMDVSFNDNKELEVFRPFVKKLVVMVGVGYSINTETTWIADAVIYQSLASHGFVDRAPGSACMHGGNWLLVDPLSHQMKLPADQLGMIVMSYFGAGFSDDYSDAVEAELVRLIGPNVQQTGGAATWMTDWSRRVAQARLVVTSMGMAAYEALAVGTHVVAVSVDEEHAGDAGAVPLIKHAGLWNEVGPEQVAVLAAETYDSISRRPRAPIDAMGVYRLARLLLE